MTNEINRLSQIGTVYWLTGLSGAGKSENAKRLADFLRRQGRPCVLLDGDELRRVIQSTCPGYTREERVNLGLQYANLCKLLASQAIDVVIATIALYSEIHQWKEENLTNCCTIFLDVPISELRRRDPKKIYERYFTKRLRNVAGLDLPVDLPPSPDIKICWRDGMDQETVWSCLEKKIHAYNTGN